MGIHKSIVETLINNQSEALRKMLSTGVGYRMEPYGELEGGSRLAKDVIEFEILDSQNTDIQDYCKIHYGLRSRSNKKFINELLDYLYANLGTNTPYALWLTTKEGTSGYTLDGEDNTQHMYVLPKDVIVISDLYNDGALFVSSLKPRDWK